MLNIRTYVNTIYGAETERDNDYVFGCICETMDRLVAEGKRNYAIYPMGRIAMMLKSIMRERYGITPVKIIDDLLCSSIPESGIISIEEAGKLREKDFILLIASNNPECYDNIRRSAYKEFESKKIIDLFPIKPLYKKDSRIISLEMASREIKRNKVPGAIAELGVYRGYFAEYISLFFPDRTFYLIDTFEGFSERDTRIDNENGYSQFEAGKWFMDTGIELVKDKMSNPERCRFIKGVFPESSILMDSKEKFCFVHLDADLYMPIRAGLEYFYPRMSPGGYIFIHDFNGYACKGVRQAVAEFCAEHETGYVCLPDSIEKGTAVIPIPFGKGAN